MLADELLQSERQRPLPLVVQNRARLYATSDDDATAPITDSTQIPSVFFRYIPKRTHVTARSCPKAAPDSPLHRVTADDCEDWLRMGTWDMPATEARLLLILSRFRAAKGRMDEAREFARVGLSLRGLHVDFRREFEEMLNTPAVEIPPK